ncbi:MAG: RNA 2',3'-cyclic phosphodiesterase [Deltaproteobacteria bacterium]|jgi:2'-5' RNA ligase|nr:RNA 2',3'-cyclic phosphodiesterase [Deltaproteobacteria bacterium]
MTDISRLFVAIALPEPVVAALRSLGAVFPDVRIIPGGQAHLTLRFLGPTPASMIPRIREALASVGGEMFGLAFGGLGTFRTGAGMVLWAGLSGNPGLGRLRDGLETALLEGLGLARDKRAFTPHVTLARMRTFRPWIAQKAEAYADEVGQPFTVSAFGLYESELRPSGAVHALVSEYPLADPGKNGP